MVVKGYQGVPRGVPPKSKNKNQQIQTNQKIHEKTSGASFFMDLLNLLQAPIHR